MKITELKLEYSGIFGTITQYSKNPYIVGYLETMKEYITECDLDNLKMCISKILVWYDDNIDKIMSNDYVLNKDDHKTTKKILENAYKHLI